MNKMTDFEKKVDELEFNLTAYLQTIVENQIIINDKLDYLLDSLEKVKISGNELINRIEYEDKTRTT